jgi:hypothetical protein
MTRRHRDAVGGPLTAKGEDKMQIAREEYAAMSKEAVHVIGGEKVAQLQPVLLH